MTHRFAISSVRFDDAQRCLEHYDLERWGGVVRRGTWRERHRDGREHDSVQDSWVELELEWDEVPRLLAHVQQAPLPERPRFRGLVLNRGRKGDAVTSHGILRWFVGPEIPSWCLTIYDTWMD